MRRDGAGPATARILLVLLAAAACDSPIAEPSLPVVSIEPLESGPLTQRVRITLETTVPLTIEYAAENGPTLIVESAPARQHDVVLPRLRPNRTYGARIVGASDAFSFDTEALPEDLARVGFEAAGSPTAELFLVHIFSPDGFRGHVIIDGAGEVVWYRRTADFPFGAARRAGGTFVLMDRGRGLQEVTAAGVVVAEVAQEPGGRELHHDVITTPRNTVLFIAHDRRAHEGTSVAGEAIWEWVPETGALERRWSSWDVLSIDEDRGPRFGDEWMHANALSIGPRGNVLMSVHYFDQVLSIAPDWSGLEWRLGGVRATIHTDGTDAFSGQHTAAEVADGRVLLFDNGVGRGGPSRAVEFALQEDRAVKQWEWISPTGTFASAVSSARRLAGGNTLVAFGMQDGVNGSRGGTEAFEVTPAGQVVWHLRVTGVRTMFRVEPWEAVAFERRADSARD